MFPCPAGCVLSFGRKSSSSNRSSRRVLCLIVQTAVQKLVENYCFSTVSEGTLGTFWARFWRCSVLQGHCVSLSGRVRFDVREAEQQQQQEQQEDVRLFLGSMRFELREEEQQQQQEQQEGSMSHFTKSATKNWSKTIVFLGF